MKYPNKFRWLLRGIIPFLLIPLLSGCWDYSPLESKYIVSGIGIDISEKNPQNIEISTIGIFNAEMNRTVRAEGRSMADALHHIQNQLEKNLIISHLKIILISDRIAKKGLIPYIDLIGRNSQIRPDMELAVVHGRAADYFVQKNFSFPINATFFTSILETGEAKVNKQELYLQSFLLRLADDGTGFALPYLRWDPKQKLLNWTGVVLMNQGRMTAVLDHREMMDLYLVKGELDRGLYTVGRWNSQNPLAQVISFRIYRPEVKKEWIRNKDQNVIRLKIILNDEILETEPWHHRPGDLSDQKKLISDIEKDLEKGILHTLQKIQQHGKIDPFHWQDEARVKWPDWYSATHWNEQFCQIHFEVDVTLHIERSGEFNL